MTKRRLLVLFVTTALLGCAAPVSDSTDIPAFDESIDPFEDFDGKADQAGGPRQPLPIPRVHYAPTLELVPIRPALRASMNWSTGRLVLRGLCSSAPRLVTTGTQDLVTTFTFADPLFSDGTHSVRKRGAHIFVTQADPDCEGSSHEFHYDVAPLLRDGARAIRLEDARHRGTMHMPSRHQPPDVYGSFWQSTWTRPLKCWSSEATVRMIYPLPIGAMADLTPWEDRRDLEFATKSRDADQLTLETRRGINHSYIDISLERTGLGVISGRITGSIPADNSRSNFPVHEITLNEPITCLELE